MSRRILDNVGAHHSPAAFSTAHDNRLVPVNCNAFVREESVETSAHIPQVPLTSPINMNISARRPGTCRESTRAVEVMKGRRKDEG